MTEPNDRVLLAAKSLGHLLVVLHGVSELGKRCEDENGNEHYQGGREGS